MVRAAGDPEQILGTVRNELRTLEPNLAITDAQTATAAVRQALWAPRMTATLLSDSMAAVPTLAIALLLFIGRELQIWHIYIAVSIKRRFDGLSDP